MQVDSFLGSSRESLAFFRCKVVHTGVSAQLQGAHKRYDRPAIIDRNLMGIRRHRAMSASDHVEEMSQRRAAQAIDMVGGGPLKAPADDHSVAVARTTVTIGAKDI